MSFVLTLVASESRLTVAHLALIRHYLENQGMGEDAEPAWLDEHKAADLPLADRPTPEQIRDMRALLAQDRIDLFAGPILRRRKKLLLADMDSTIVTVETLDELAAFAGLKDRIAAITDSAMRGELDFKAALRARVSLLKNLPESALQETLAGMKLSAGAELLVGTMRRHGAVCVLVSGGFSYFTAPVARMAGFQYHHGNTLMLSGGVLTGQVEEPILDKDAKLGFLRKYATEMGLDARETMAVGDGANDLPMLEAAGAGFGYRPKPLLAQRLDNLVLYGDLTALLYAQGYKKSDMMN